jgi:hypothetical protein
MDTLTIGMFIAVIIMWYILYSKQGSNSQTTSTSTSNRTAMGCSQYSSDSTNISVECVQQLLTEAGCTVNANSLITAQNTMYPEIPLNAIQLTNIKELISEYSKLPAGVSPEQGIPPCK